MKCLPSLKLTNIAPEHRPSQPIFRAMFWDGLFSGAMCSREGTVPIVAIEHPPICRCWKRDIFSQLCWFTRQIVMVLFVLNRWSITRDPRDLCMFILPDWCLSHVHEFGKGTMKKKAQKTTQFIVVVFAVVVVVVVVAVGFAVVCCLLWLPSLSSSLLLYFPISNCFKIINDHRKLWESILAGR